MIKPSSYGFLGPSAALGGPGAHKGKAGNAVINGVSGLTGRDIAYVACQVRFAISSLEEWSQMDGEFSYVEFFWKVVDSLRGDEGDAIVARFNHDVFGTSTAKPSAARTEEVPDEFALQQQQRAAKRARVNAAAAEAAATAAAAAAIGTPLRNPTSIFRENVLVDFAEDGDGDSPSNPSAESGMSRLSG
ncbi:hypothetical protein DFH09DRAFT_1323221 [Mycena vulgaris]|nr:hypothetical protein DFH09DRAFT_1323221 [Mycena vulgaris]